MSASVPSRPFHWRRAFTLVELLVVIAIIGVLVSMLLVLTRAFLGPTVFDRVLAANTFGTKTVLLIAVSGFLFGRPEWLDLALLYALMNFIGMIALLRFAKFENLASDERIK